MTFAFLPFPYLKALPLLNQFILLVVLVTVSYFYRRPRLILVALLTIYTIFKITVPLARWGYAAFKAIAMFGFYLHFFIVGVGYIVTGAIGVWNLPELLQRFVDHLEGK